MAEAVDQASNNPAPPNAESASKAGDKPDPANQAPAVADLNASLGEVMNAMQLAEDAVSKAVQDMADSQDPSILNNLK